MAISKSQDTHRVFTETFNRGDLPALQALYEREARVVTQSGQVMVGREAIGAVLQQFLALRGTIKMDTVDVIEAGEVALLRAHWRLAGTGPDGKPLEIQGHSVEVVRRQSDGNWLFVIDHPFGAG
jgi:uncharacterized protein (TIGR02246 family)